MVASSEQTPEEGGYSATAAAAALLFRVLFEALPRKSATPQQSQKAGYRFAFGLRDL